MTIESSSGRDLHVVWVNETARLAGGAERYILETAQRLRARGVRSTVLYEVSGGMDPGFTAHFDGAFPLVATERQLRELQPDVVYVHRLGDESLLAQLYGEAPLVRFFHDHALFCPRTHKYTTLRHQTCERPVGARCYPCLGVVNRADTALRVRLRTVASVKREQAVHAGFAGFVVGSEYMRSHVIANGFDAGRVHVIPPGVQAGKVTSPVVRDAKLLVFAGTLVRGKGLDTLLKAMPYLGADVRLQVIGDGQQEQLFRNLAEQLRISERVTFSGRLPKQGVHRWFARAACVVVPSRAPETFCLVGPEAMLHGTPIVASRVGGVGEWLKDGETGHLFESGDSRGLARAVRSLLEDPEAARRIGDAGRRWVESQFRPDDHADTLTALFDRIRRAAVRPDVARTRPGATVAPVTPDASRLTAKGGPGVEAYIQTVLAEAARQLDASLDPAEIRCVVLLGGYGRGEGGVVNVDGEERPHNNLDLLIVSRGLRAHPTLHDRARKALDRVEARFPIDIDVGCVSETSLRTSQCLVMWYDMRFGHKVILGDASFVRGLRRFTQDRIEPWDARNLMVNRGTLLVINELILDRGDLDASLRKTIVRHMMKAIIGYGDAHLFFTGRYDWSYVEKQHRMRKSDADPVFRKLYDEAMEFRFSPHYDDYVHRDLGQWHADVRPLFEALHLDSERRRLEDPDLQWREYPDAALRHDLLHRDVGWRTPRKAKALLRSSSPPAQLSPLARTGYRAAGAQGRLPILFPLVAYDAAEPELRQLARDALQTTDTDSVGMHRAYLREWIEVSDRNSRWGELL